MESLTIFALNLDVIALILGMLAPADLLCAWLSHRMFRRNIISKRSGGLSLWDLRAGDYLHTLTTSREGFLYSVVYMASPHRVIRFYDSAIGSVIYTLHDARGCEAVITLRVCESIGDAMPGSAFDLSRVISGDADTAEGSTSIFASALASDNTGVYIDKDSDCLLSRSVGSLRLQALAGVTLAELCDCAQSVAASVACWSSQSPELARGDILTALADLSLAPQAIPSATFNYQRRDDIDCTFYILYDYKPTQIRLDETRFSIPARTGITRRSGDHYTECCGVWFARYNDDVIYSVYRDDILSLTAVALTRTENRIHSSCITAISRSEIASHKRRLSIDSTEFYRSIIVIRGKSGDRNYEIGFSRGAATYVATDTVMTSEASVKLHHLSTEIAVSCESRGILVSSDSAPRSLERILECVYESHTLYEFFSRAYPGDS